MLRRPSRCRWRATTWWWTSRPPPSLRGAQATKQSMLPCRTMDCFASLAMTGLFLFRHPLCCRLPLLRIAHQRHKPIDAVDEFSVGHGEEQREDDAEMQREQRAHGWCL